jgi:hypothetical protein
MQSKFPNEKFLLHLLCQAPSGLFLSDIQSIVLGNEYRFGDWQAFLTDMIITNDSDTHIESTQTHKKHGFRGIIQTVHEEIREI